jgi:hypothetical protein
MSTLRCVQCNAELLHGEPMHELNCNGKIQLWCIECIDQYSEAMWPDDWGPYPSRLQHRRDVGRA